jgi:hypothetical protein
MRNEPSLADGRPVDRPLSRRAVLGTVGAVGLSGLAGCSDLADSFANAILQDVNCFNGTSKPVSGTVRVVGPDGSEALMASYDLEPPTEDRSTEATRAVYDEVWGASGTYEAFVELANGTTVRGETAAEESVTIDAPDEQMLAIGFGLEGTGPGISFAVTEEFSELGNATASRS